MKLLQLCGEFLAVALNLAAWCYFGVLLRRTGFMTRSTSIGEDVVGLVYMTFGLAIVVTGALHWFPTARWLRASLVSTALLGLCLFAFGNLSGRLAQKPGPDERAEELERHEALRRQGVDP